MIEAADGRKMMRHSEVCEGGEEGSEGPGAYEGLTVDGSTGDSHLITTPWSNPIGVRRERMNPGGEGATPRMRGSYPRQRA